MFKDWEDEHIFYADHEKRLVDYNFINAVRYNGEIDLNTVVRIMACHEGVKDEEFREQLWKTGRTIPFRSKYPDGEGL